MAFKALRKFFGLPVARVANDAGERIESLRFSVPALRVSVLEYAPGQLQTRAPELQNKTVYLYYPPEAVGDAEFLKSLENSPIVLGGHNQSTNELDKKIDGWPRTVRYDEGQKAAIVEGVVKGAREAAYVRANFKTPAFGASALIDVYGLRIEEGTTPNGEKYNAVAEKLKATHLTLAPSVRDPENKIEIMNAVVINSHGTMSNASVERVTVSVGGESFSVTAQEYNGKPIYRIVDSAGKISVVPQDGLSPQAAVKKYRARNTTTTQNTEKRIMTPEEIAAIAANAARDVVTAKNAEDEMASMKNELGELKNLVNSLVKNMAKNADAEKEAEKKPAENADDEKKEGETENADEGATLENAKPSQKIVAAFSTAYNAEWKRGVTPGFATLANLAGIKTEGVAKGEIITAVNAHYVEIQNAAKSEPVAGRMVAGGVF